MAIHGPGEIIGENPFGLVSGAGAVWIKTKQAVGTITLTATHQYLPAKKISINVSSAAAEEI